MTYNGLTSAQVVASRAKYGANIMPMPAPKSAWYFLVDVFRDKINLILLILLGLFVGLALIGVGDLYEAAGIGAVLAVVSVISVMTQLRAQRSARELQRRTGRHFCRVIRDGTLHRVDSADLVVGDIVLLSAGEVVCADGYMVDGAVSVNNSILNGESDEAPKAPVPGYVYDRRRRVTADDYTDANSVFAGTTVHGGAGKMCVARIGADTQNAEIMQGLHEVSAPRTSLQIQIDDMAGKIGKIGSLSALAIFVVLVATQYAAGTLGMGMSALRVILGDITVALTVFVAAVPEGLPFIISIIIGRNTARMARNHMLPRNPMKIPAAGNLHIICTDKTGTLTRGHLSVVTNYLGDGADVGANMAAAPVVADMFMQGAVLNNGAAYDAENAPVGGNSTDRAILGAVSPDVARQITADFDILRQIPFNSANKFALSVAMSSSGETVTFVRGAPEIILTRCSHYLDAAGRVRKLKPTDMDSVLHRAAARAMRMVATAYYRGDWSGDGLPDEMVLVAATAMRDDIRPDVPGVMETVHRAGVQVIMITGDNIDTARAIARDCGIMGAADDIAITASELDARSDDWIRKNLDRLRVVARATPATKLRLVTVAQSMNKSIGMCGDGTNDAPALRRADVGFAMGDGTDVCKEAADIVITDNNFVSVAGSVLIGRTFLHNIVSFLRFQLPINFALVALCLIWPLIWGGPVMSAVQILIINIVMDSMNSLSFGGEAPRPEYMLEMAPPKDAPLLGRRNMVRIAVSTMMFLAIFGIMMSAPVRAMFDSSAQYMGARFALLVIMAIFNGFNIRTDGFNLLSGLRANPMFIYVAVFVISGCVLCVTYGGAALGVAPLAWDQWAVVFALAALIIPADLLRKWLASRHRSYIH